MVSSSTNVDNPVNRIASLLDTEVLGNAPQKKEETLEAVETQEETLEVSDESQPQEAENAESQEVEESAESSEEEPGINTLNNLSEELDIDISDMYALSVNLSRGDNLPDGGSLSIGELKTFYEKNADIESLREDVNKREQEIQTRSDEIQSVPQVSNELLQARAQVLAIQDQYNRTDWQGLRNSNPAEYSALQSDFRMQFETAKNNEQIATQAVETHLTETRRQQQARLLEAMPELKDESIMKQVESEVLTYASKFGFTPNDVANVEDSRLMRLLITASKSEVAKATAIEKREQRLPASNSPSARKPLPGRRAALKRLTEKARSTGQIKDQANAVAELLRGS